MRLRVGFAKGRGAVAAMDLMRAGGVLVPEEFRACRMTVHHAPEHDLDCFVLRGEDLPALLASGHLDAAVGSSIVFDELAADGTSRVGALLDIGRCRLSLIQASDAAELPRAQPGRRRLRTRYPRTAARLLTASGNGGWSISPLRGCVEVGLFLGICDAIVDIVETGWTLRALALQEQLVLCTVQHQVRLRAGGSEILPRLRALMPQVAWNPEPTATRCASRT